MLSPLSSSGLKNRHSTSWPSTTNSRLTNGSDAMFNPPRASIAVVSPVGYGSPAHVGQSPRPRHRSPQQRRLHPPPRLLQRQRPPRRRARAAIVEQRETGRARAGHAGEAAAGLGAQGGEHGVDDGGDAAGGVFEVVAGFGESLQQRGGGSDRPPRALILRSAPQERVSQDGRGGSGAFRSILRDGRCRGLLRMRAGMGGTRWGEVCLPRLQAKRPEHRRGRDRYARIDQHAKERRQARASRRCRT